MTQQLAIDRGRTALLIMDYENDILSGYADQMDALLERAASVLRGTRQAGIPVIYVAVRYREGYPEVMPQNRGRYAGRHLEEGSSGAEIHSAVAPQAGEIVVTKRRTGPFSTTDLAAVLNSKGVRTLVLMGVSTGGVVLSTVRWGADIDYDLVVVADCCADGDPEVHRVLTEKVFPRQARVVTTQEFLQAIATA